MHDTLYTRAGGGHSERGHGTGRGLQAEWTERQPNQRKAPAGLGWHPQREGDGHFCRPAAALMLSAASSGQSSAARTKASVSLTWWYAGARGARLCTHAASR